jgi:hypothetical protein
VADMKSKQSRFQILDKIKNDCETDTLIFTGRYEPAKEANYGFFWDVKHESGRKLQYPITQETIDKIFRLKPYIGLMIRQSL